jgi:hypothetical protein
VLVAMAEQVGAADDESSPMDEGVAGHAPVCRPASRRVRDSRSGDVIGDAVVWLADRRSCGRNDVLGGTAWGEGHACGEGKKHDRVLS